MTIFSKKKREKVSNDELLEQINFVLFKELVSGEEKEKRITILKEELFFSNNFVSFWNYQKSPTLLLDVFNYYINRTHQKTKKVKTRGEVRGGGRKPWRQKGTGKARQGSIRSPQFRKGGVVHGPTGEQGEIKKLNEKQKHSAFLQLLIEKMKQKRIFIVDELSFSIPSTAEAVVFLKKNNLPFKKLLVVIPNFDLECIKSFNNVKGIEVISVNQFFFLPLFFNNWIVFTKMAWNNLQERFGN